MSTYKDLATQCHASALQHQFWLINELHPGNCAYNIASLFNIKGPLDVPALEQSILSVIARHDIFRTTFQKDIGRLAQYINIEPAFKLPQTDIEAPANGNPAPEFERLIIEQTTRPFDLEKGPLLRACLIRHDETHHTLLIVMHHIITDLRSKELLSNEIAAAYNQLASNIPHDLTDQVIQYRDYANWQKSWLDSPEAKKMAAFWAGDLKNHSGILNLATDRSRPTAATLKGSHIPFEAPPHLYKAIKALSKQTGMDTFIILLAAYLALLFRTTYQKDIIIGVPLTNRRQNNHKNTMGCFVNILPLGFLLSSDMPFSELIKQVRHKMLLAHRNQEIPFTNILDAVQPKRNPGTNALFQVGFTVEPSMKLNLHNLEITPRKIHNKGAQLDIFLSFLDITETIQGYFEYNSEIFDEATIRHFCDHYQNLLEIAATAPDTPVGAIDFLSSAERTHLVTQLNDTAVDYPTDACLHHLFEQQVMKTPDALAAVFGQTKLTYDELNKRANQLAHYLKDFGVGPNTFVGIFINRSLEMLIAVYAVLKTGAAYVPLDPAFPKQRLAYILEDTKAPAMITHSDNADELKLPSVQSICIDRDIEKIGAYPDHNPEHNSTPDHLAYVLHTSGSTGKPKGVQVPHGAVINFLVSMQKEPGIKATDKLLAVTTLSFDISVLELFLPLTVGAGIVIADQDTTVNGQALLSLIRSSGSTIMQATPATWHLLFAAGLKTPLPLKVLCGGENLPPGLANQLCAISDSVWNLYGPTETTIWSTCARINPDATVTAGRPIANTQLYIVDENLQLTPHGVPGELLIGGDGVSHGYLNRPNLTQEKFIPDTFSGNANQRVYRTGDLARYNKDGELLIIGRMDYQVKFRGFRIELGEIEAVMSKHPAIKQAAVILHNLSETDKRIVAYFTLKADQTATTNELREFLSSDLPDYMLPATYQLIDTMPLTDNGKINRKTLPEPVFEGRTIGLEYAPPDTETEKQLCRLWQEILHFDKIGINDNFFEIGGSSLLAVECTSRIESRLNTKLSVTHFFQYPTIAALAGHLDRGETKISEQTITRAQRQRQALARRKRR